MVNKLAVIAAVGLTASVVSLASAAVIGSYEFGGKSFNLADFNWNDKQRCSFDRSAKTETREIAWDGGDHAIIKLFATVRYSPENGDRVLVSGNPQLLSRVQMKDGTLELDCNLRNSSDGLEVMLPGRAFRSFALNGAGKLVLENIDQKDLAIILPGASEVEASGKAEDVKVSIMGAGEANLAKLVVQKMDISITGAGDAEISAHQDADITIIGAGSVRLMTEPKNLRTNIIGAGDIIHTRR